MPSAPDQPCWRLRPISQPDLAPTLSIPEQGLTMGRDPGNVLPLAGAAYPGVSSFHCKISLVLGELMVEDLDSKNGTLVDGEAVTRKTLRKGSILTLGVGGPRFAALWPREK